jgi:hypothetical protein
LLSDVEEKQRQRNRLLRQSDLAQRAGEAVQQADRERNDRRLALTDPSRAEFGRRNARGRLKVLQG